MADDLDDFYADLGHLDNWSNNSSDKHRNSPPNYLIIKLQDANALAGIVNGQSVSVPLAINNKISMANNKHKDTIVLFLTKIGEISINYDKYM